jgi:hypothetical protein
MKDESGGRRRYVVVGGEGSGQVFNCTSATEGCTPQRGYHGSLTASNTSVVYRARSGTEYRYARLSTTTALPRFWLTSIVDARGNETFLEYGGTEIDGELLRVFEPGNKRLLQLAYARPPGARHMQLTRVELFSNPSGDRAAERFAPIDDPGVCVAFSYDAHENLSSAARYDGDCSAHRAPLTRPEPREPTEPRTPLTKTQSPKTREEDQEPQDKRRRPRAPRQEKTREEPRPRVPVKGDRREPAGKRRCGHRGKAWRQWTQVSVAPGRGGCAWKGDVRWRDAAAGG